MATDHDPAVQRLRTALDLFEAGCEMKRAALRREHPGLSPEEEARLLAAWLRDRPLPMEGVPGFRVRREWP